MHQENEKEEDCQIRQPKYCISLLGVCGAAETLLLALYNPKTSVFIQKRHSYSSNRTSETPGDSENALLD